MKSPAKTKTIKHLSNPRPVRRVSVVVILFLIGIWLMPTPKEARSAGIDTADIAIVLEDEAVNTAGNVDITFTWGTLTNGNTIDIYLGDVDGGSGEWQLNSVAAEDITCDDNGTGETYNGITVAAATATVPMKVHVVAQTVGATATATHCVIGDNAPDPKTPTVAGSYSVAIVTTNDSGAGIAYVGNANDVTVSATVLPNLALTISNGDGAICVTSGGGITSCDFGVMTTSAIKEGSYRVGVGTNAASGATMNISESGDLGVINDVADGTVDAGSEEYGISAAPTNTVGTWTLTSPYNTGDDPIEAPAEVADSNAPVDMTLDYVTITHKIAIASTTPPGANSHTVIWTASATF